MLKINQSYFKNPTGEIESGPKRIQRLAPPLAVANAEGKMAK